MSLSPSDLEIISQNPLKEFRSTYQKFFCSRTGLTLDEVREGPEILDIIGDSGFDNNSRELFQLLLCELSFAPASRLLIHSGDQMCNKLLLFAGEWPNQLNLRGGNILTRCTDVLLEVLIPDPNLDPSAVDVGIWEAVGDLLSGVSADTAQARQSAVEFVTGYAVKYAKEHPYLLGVNVALMVVGFAPATLASPILGYVGFGATGVRAGTAAAGWQSMLGAVPKGSLFSAFQSAAATGAMPLVSGCSWVLNAGCTGINLLRGGQKKNNDSDGGGSDEGSAP